MRDNWEFKRRRFWYYLKNFAAWPLPRRIYQRRLTALLEQARTHPDAEALRTRADYYCRVQNDFIVDGARIKDFNDTRHSTYYFDALQAWRYFPPEYRVRWIFGDVTQVPDSPAIVKSRPIAEPGVNANSVLLALNRVRHFFLVRDSVPFAQKKNTLIWRGKSHNQSRRDFLQRYYRHPLCDIGQTNRRAENVAWQKPFLNVKHQLRHKFILSMEGNDTATNLKWIMHSNSLCLMRRPRFETWFMEGRLKAGEHYVELEDDHADWVEKVTYYAAHPEEAMQIIKNANAYVRQFLDPARELLIALLVMEKYFIRSGQMFDAARHQPVPRA